MKSVRKGIAQLLEDIMTLEGTQMLSKYYANKSEVLVQIVDQTYTFPLQIITTMRV